MNPVVPGRSGPALLARWHARFGRMLGTYFRRHGVGATDCDDLTQDVFVRLAQRDDLAEVRQAEHYLRRVVGHVLIDWHRRRSARAAALHGPIDGVEIRDDAASPERVALAHDTLARLRAAVARMPARTATVFTLHHVEDMPYAAIAERCGIAVRTVEDHMARANLFLLAALEQPE